MALGLEKQVLNLNHLDLLSLLLRFSAFFFKLIFQKKGGSDAEQRKGKNMQGKYWPAIKRKLKFNKNFSTFLQRATTEIQTLGAGLCSGESLYGQF